MRTYIVTLKNGKEVIFENAYDLTRQFLKNSVLRLIETEEEYNDEVFRVGSILVNDGDTYPRGVKIEMPAVFSVIITIMS